MPAVAGELNLGKLRQEPMQKSNDSHQDSGFAFGTPHDHLGDWSNETGNPATITTTRSPSLAPNSFEEAATSDSEYQDSDDVGADVLDPRTIATVLMELSQCPDLPCITDLERDATVEAVFRQRIRDVFLDYKGRSAREEHVTRVLCILMDVVQSPGVICIEPSLASSVQSSLYTVSSPIRSSVHTSSISTTTNEDEYASAEGYDTSTLSSSHTLHSSASTPTTRSAANSEGFSHRDPPQTPRTGTPSILVSTTSPPSTNSSSATIRSYSGGSMPNTSYVLSSDGEMRVVLSTSNLVVPLSPLPPPTLSLSSIRAVHQSSSTLHDGGVEQATGSTTPTSEGEGGAEPSQPQLQSELATSLQMALNVIVEHAHHLEQNMRAYQENSSPARSPQSRSKSPSGIKAFVKGLGLHPSRSRGPRGGEDASSVGEAQRSAPPSPSHPQHALSPEDIKQFNKILNKVLRRFAGCEYGILQDSPIIRKDMILHNLLIGCVVNHHHGRNAQQECCMPTANICVQVGLQTLVGTAQAIFDRRIHRIVAQAICEQFPHIPPDFFEDDSKDGDVDGGPQPRAATPGPLGNIDLRDLRRQHGRPSGNA
ncbi:hypothetical protein FA13DRAFT_1791982 [Coprinellus micaceus]|uniref:Uncharacterized protein n=1 Tax=Coprinellus micaceus TaxID=71717 RepID=A0A4Y7T9P1_COPMI|nr:hypothetical protein FA13DRAFT_1791982 [Coprinellus micaceus]